MTERPPSADTPDATASAAETPDVMASAADTPDVTASAADTPDATVVPVRPAPPMWEPPAAAATVLPGAAALNDATTISSGMSRPAAPPAPPLPADPPVGPATPTSAVPPWSDTPWASPSAPTVRTLRRSQDRRLAGVCGGLAEYFSIDATVVRLLFLVGLFMGGSTVIAYLAAWVLMPEPARPYAAPAYHPQVAA